MRRRPSAVSRTDIESFTRLSQPVRSNEAALSSNEVGSKNNEKKDEKDEQNKQYTLPKKNDKKQHMNKLDAPRHKEVTKDIIDFARDPEVNERYEETEWAENTTFVETENTENIEDNIVYKIRGLNSNTSVSALPNTNVSALPNIDQVNTEKKNRFKTERNQVDTRKRDDELPINTRFQHLEDFYDTMEDDRIDTQRELEIEEETYESMYG